MSDLNCILIVEDNDDDALLLRRCMDKAEVKNPRYLVTDGAAAINYLSGSGEYADRAQYPLPALVLLDLKLPYRSGFEVLEWLREQPFFEDLTVIVLTSSDQPSDIQRAYQLGASTYLVKPCSREQLKEVLAKYLTTRSPAAPCAPVSNLFPGFHESTTGAVPINPQS